MPWTLEIHHLDVEQGDATLIIARNGVITRSVLIDGGLGKMAPRIHKYITNIVGLVQLDVMVATHYDRDHFNGLSDLLLHYAWTYDNTIIFDQGWTTHEADVLKYTKAINGINAEGRYTAVHRDPNAVGSRIQKATTRRVGLNRARPTSVVSNGTFIFGETLTKLGAPAIPVAGVQAVGGNPFWLVGREVMWTNGLGNYDRDLAPGGPPGTPGGPPAIKCIAANQGILQTDGSIGLFSGALDNEENVKNQKSLVFEIKFNNFRYYIGGDIGIDQEGGGDPTIINPPFSLPIMNYLNPNYNLNGRIHAMKLSHHGSSLSSSEAFINRLGPKVAFVSSGINNYYGYNPELINGQPIQNGHPNQNVINRVSLNPHVQRIYMTNDRHNNDYVARINNRNAIPTVHNLIGGGHYSPKTIVAGVWGVYPGVINDGPRQLDSNIVLTINEFQSQQPSDNVPFFVGHFHPPYVNVPTPFHAPYLNQASYDAANNPIFNKTIAVY